MTSSTDTTADFYRLLGVSSDASMDEIGAGYRAKLRLWHPDLLVDTTEDVRQAATEMTARLNEAYECLRDPDRRAAYDTSRRAGTTSTRRPSSTGLVVTPQTMRCDVTPGDTLRLSFDIRADGQPGRAGPRVRTSDRLRAPTFTTSPLTANSARVTLRADTSKLDAERLYNLPLEVAWGESTGTAILQVRTAEVRKADSTPPYRREPASSSRGRRTRRPDHRVRDLAVISLGGIVFPLLIIMWASGVMPVQTPANPPVVAAICAGVIAATTWLLTSSRLLRQPDRLARIGGVWGRLMRWSGWILLGSSAFFLGIPAVVLIVMAAIATPFLGLVVIAFVSGRLDSRKR